MKQMDEAMGELQKMSNNPARSFTPRFDVKEAKDSYTLEGELPGIEQKDVTIEFSDENTLTIKGRTERSTESGKKPEAKGVTDGEKQEMSDSKEVATTDNNREVVKADELQHHYWVSERSVGEFARSFSFPGHVDQDSVKASLKNGILSVVVPKHQKQNASRRINIE